MVGLSRSDLVLSDRIETCLEWRIVTSDNCCDHPRVVSTTLDPDRRRVTLAEAAWEHIKERRPALTGSLGEIMAAVREPTVRHAGREPDEEWFYRRGAGPSRWLKVVVA